jgi:hypothetical protein
VKEKKKKKKKQNQQRRKFQRQIRNHKKRENDQRCYKKKIKLFKFLHDTKDIKQEENENKM